MGRILVGIQSRDQTAPRTGRKQRAKVRPYHDRREKHECLVSCMYFLVFPTIAPSAFKVKILFDKLTRGVVSSWALQWRSRSEDDADTKQAVLIFLCSFCRLVQRGVTVTSCTMTTQKQKKNRWWASTCHCFYAISLHHERLTLLQSRLDQRRRKSPSCRIFSSQRSSMSTVIHCLAAQFSVEQPCISARSIRVWQRE